MKLDDILSGKHVIKSEKQLKRLMYSVTFEPHSFTYEEFLNLFSLYDSGSLSDAELSYALYLISDITYMYGVSADGELKEAIEKLIEEVHRRDPYVFDDEEIKYYKRIFKNAGLPFKEKDLKDDELLEYVNKYSEVKDDTLSDETIDNFRYALDLLVKHKNPDGVFLYGRIMYGDGVHFKYKQDFKVALDCYLFAGEHGINQGYVNAGYIYYYDRLGNGKPDYENAFNCYLKAFLNEANWNASYKLSDMYRYGLYVKKDLNTAFALVETIYYQIFRIYKERPLMEDLPLAEVSSRYYELVTEVGLTTNQEDTYNLLRAYFYQLEKVKNHQYYGDVSVLKKLKEIILAHFKGQQLSLNFQASKDFYIKNQTYTVKCEESGFCFRGIYLGEVPVDGDDPCLTSINYRFRVDKVLYAGYYNPDAEYFDVNYLNHDSISIILFEPYNFPYDEDGYKSIESDEDLDALNELLKQDDYKVKKIKVGRYIEKYKFYKEVAIELKGKNSKETIYLKAFFVSVLSFNGINEGGSIYVDLYDDGEFLISEIDDSNYLFKCLSLSVKENSGLKKAAEA